MSRGRREPATPDPRPRRAARGEALAARALEQAGLEVLDRNWRAGRRELDLVAREGRVIAFVEVKTRSPGPQAPLEAIGRAKRRDLRRAAEAWIHAHPGAGREFRFDAVSVRLLEDGGHRVHHVRDAFYADET